MNQQLATGGMFRKRAARMSLYALYVAFALGVLLMPDGWILLAGLLVMMIIAFVTMTLAVGLTPLVRRWWFPETAGSSRNNAPRLRWLTWTLAFATVVFWLLAVGFIAGGTRVYHSTSAGGVYHASALGWTWVQILLVVGMFVSFQAVRAMCGRALRHRMNC